MVEQPTIFGTHKRSFFFNLFIYLLIEKTFLVIPVDIGRYRFKSGLLAKMIRFYENDFKYMSIYFILKQVSFNGKISACQAEALGWIPSTCKSK